MVLVTMVDPKPNPDCLVCVPRSPKGIALVVLEWRLSAIPQPTGHDYEDCPKVFVAGVAVGPNHPILVLDRQSTS